MSYSERASDNLVGAQSHNINHCLSLSFRNYCFILVQVPTYYMTALQLGRDEFLVSQFAIIIKEVDYVLNECYFQACTHSAAYP